MDSESDHAAKCAGCSRTAPGLVHVRTVTGKSSGLAVTQTFYVCVQCLKKLNPDRPSDMNALAGEPPE